MSSKPELNLNLRWKVPKHGVISGPNTRKYGPETYPSLDTFDAVKLSNPHYFLQTAVLTESTLWGD